MYVIGCIYNVLLNGLTTDSALCTVNVLHCILMDVQQQ